MVGKAVKGIHGSYMPLVSLEEGKNEELAGKSDIGALSRSEVSGAPCSGLVRLDVG